MTDKITWDDVFEQLTPPPGGLQTLRVRLDTAAEEKRPRWPGTRVRWAVATATACFALWLVLPGTWWHGGARPKVWLDAVAAADNPALVRLGLAEPAAEAVAVPPQWRHSMAVQQVETATPGVLYFRVAVLPGS